MVITRKRSCSASETTPGTPRVAKSRKQDEEEKVSAPRTTLRCVATSGTPTTPRRTRRVTDSSVSVTPSTSTKAKHSDLDSQRPVKATQSEESNDGSSENVESSDKDITTRWTRRAKDCTTSVTPSTRTKGRNSNLDQQTPRKAAQSEESSDSPAESIDSSYKGEYKKRKYVVNLMRIGTPTPQSPRHRTASACTPTVSIPVRRSRRLSGSGVEDSSSQDTPSKKSSIARILGAESTPKEEVNKSSVLPVIEEDVEHSHSKQAEGGSPCKETKTKHPLEEFQMQYKKFTLLPSIDDEAGSDSQDIKTENIGNKSTAVKDPREVTQDVTSEITEEVQGKNRKEVMVAEDLKSTSRVPDIESSGKKIVETEGEQDNKLDLEKLKTENEEVAEVINNQENKAEKSKPSESSNTKKYTKAAETCKEINVSHTTPDENANSEITSVNGLFSSMESGNDPKVIPEMEKKIEQLRNIPKGLPISGRWWKKDKQRFSSINKNATGKKSWAKKMQLKQWRGEVLAKSAAIEAEKQKKKEDLKERQRINKIRREENAKKSEVVQVIKDPRKIKKMKRKQLRYLETRDTTSMK